MTYASPPGNLRQIPTCWNCSAFKTRFPARLATFQGAHQSENCIRLSIFRTSTITYKIMQTTSTSYRKS
jgi:hypothetical protein